MRLFAKRQSAPKYDPAAVRGVTDAELRKLSDPQIVALAVAVLMEALGIEDDPLIDECYRRGTRGLTLAKAEQAR